MVTSEISIDNDIEMAHPNRIIHYQKGKDDEETEDKDIVGVHMHVSPIPQRPLPSCLLITPTGLPSEPTVSASHTTDTDRQRNSINRQRNREKKQTDTQTDRQTDRDVER